MLNLSQSWSLAALPDSISELKTLNYLAMCVKILARVRKFSVCLYALAAIGDPRPGALYSQPGRSLELSPFARRAERGWGRFKNCISAMSR